MQQPLTPWILISHSARQGHARRLRDAIYLALGNQKLEGKPRYRVLLDESELKPGDPWRSVNDSWLWHSDGVVLLLNQAALRDESYVLYECAVMWQRWRNSEHHFRFVIVRFPDVDDALLEKKLKPLQLPEIQQIKLSRLFLDDCEQAGPPGLDAEVAATVAKVVTAMELLPVARSAHIIEERLVNTLVNQTREGIQLRKLCESLQLDHATLALGKEEASRQIIRRLLAPEDREAAKGLEELKETASYLLTLFPSDHFRRFVNDLIPFCWVNAEAATRLCQIATRSEGNAVLWTRRWSLSEKMYLRRGWCKPLARVIYVSARSGDVEDWKARVKDALAIAFNSDPGATSADQLHETIARFIRKRGEPVWIIVSAELAGFRILEKLTQEWREVRFFLFEDGNSADSLPEEELRAFERLAPALDPSIEQDAAQAWADLMADSGVPREKILTGEMFV